MRLVEEKVPDGACGGDFIVATLRQTGVNIETVCKLDRVRDKRAAEAQSSSAQDELEGGAVVWGSRGRGGAAVDGVGEPMTTRPIVFGTVIGIDPSKHKFEHVELKPLLRDLAPSLEEAARIAQRNAETAPGTEPTG